MTEHASDLFPADAPPPGAYTLDPERTTIRADVKAMFGLLTVHGTFRLEAGQVNIAADPGASSVQASIAAGSFASGHTTRDADCRLGHLAGRRGLPGDHLHRPGRAPRRRRLGGARVGDRARDRRADRDPAQ